MLRPVGPVFLVLDKYNEGLDLANDHQFITFNLDHKDDSMDLEHKHKDLGHKHHHNLGNEALSWSNEDNMARGYWGVWGRLLVVCQVESFNHATRSINHGWCDG